VRTREASPRRSLAALALVLAPSALVVACSWDPSKPFERDAPAVKEAIAQLEAGSPKSAAETLEGYLSTGACKEGSIGLPDSVRRLPNGSFDLGLALFKVGESFGARFGDEEGDAGSDEARQKRATQVACALVIAQHVASDPDAPLELRARARYLEGNLDFLGTDYEAAVRAYDQALALAPGMVDAGDPVGRDAAWNRAIALRRIEDKKDAGNDASSPDGGQPGDGGNSPPDSGRGDSGGSDSGGGGQDSGSSGDSGSPPPHQPDGGGGEDAGTPPPSEPDAAPPPAARENPDERVLDQLENAPTVQEEDAKRRAATRRRVRGMEDK
jgi:hypothetical protein